MVKGDNLVINLSEYETDERVSLNKEDEKKTLEQLIKELKIEENPKEEDEECDMLSVINWDRISEIKNAIAQKLGLISPDIFEAWQEDVMEKIADELTKIEDNLENHRHELNKTFSAKGLRWLNV